MFYYKLRYKDGSLVMSVKGRVMDSVEMVTGQMVIRLLLTIAVLEERDSGNYTCSPQGDWGQSSQLLHVIGGKNDQCAK